MDGRIGDVLREAREARGVELEEVERVTKIRSRFLAAIEEERWDVLPGRAYAAGFVRTYAEFLGLDPAPLVERLRGELEPGSHAEEMPPEPIVQRGTLPTGLRRRLSGRLLAGLAGGAVIVALLAFAVTAGEDDPDRAGAPPPAADQAPTGTDDASSATDATPEAGGESIVPESEPDPERAELLVEATGTVWVCVVDGRGELLVAGETLAAGDSRGPFGARRMLVTLGNGLAELAANGEALELPQAAEPLGFEITADGVEELPPPDHPTCD